MQPRAIVRLKWVGDLGVGLLARPSLPSRKTRGRTASCRRSTTLRGSRSRATFVRCSVPENDLGRADGSLKLENISLMFAFTESQQAALTALLDDQQNPSSPSFHHWLTPEQFAGPIWAEPE